MTLRCWPNCLARVNESAAGSARRRIGRTVEIGEYYGLTISGKPSWYVDGKAVRSDRPGYKTHSIPDAWLTPITPPPGSETIETQQEREVTA